MTREEQIIAKASKDSEIFYKVNDNYGDCFHGGFIDGAKWADEHPKKGLVNIEDVCRFLDEHLYTSTSTGDYDYGQEYICSDFDNATDLIFALRKAMEE